ncbi:hypothetical protein [uncultured Mediterranean phage uvMED]|nr:hypothetical protein [uncultured Mediterranean phage uvMED]
MTFPILGGNGAVGGYSIDNSLRFDYFAPNSLSRTLSGSGNISSYTFSTWAKRSNFGNYMYLFSHRNSGESDSYGVSFDISSDKIYYYGGSINHAPNSLRDPSAWYHIVFSVNSGSFNLYVNGSSVLTGTAQSVVAGKPMGIGFYNHSSGSFYFDGYQAEFHFIDGTAKTPTDFGEYDEDSGIWKPKEYTGTYGTNGFYLDFENSGSLGADQSGNGNNFTPTNIVSSDQMPDTPTNNFCTLNGVDKDGHTNSDANLEIAGNVVYGMQRGTIGASSGKWYFEARLDSFQNDTAIALANENENIFTRFSGETTNSVGYLADGRFFYNSSATTYSSLSAGDIFQIAFDADTGKIWIGKNNTWQNSGDPANGTGQVQTVSWNYFLPAGRTVNNVNGNGKLHYNFGQDSSFSGETTAQNNADNNGFGDFYYSPPSGFLALCTQNLATELSPTIDDGSQYFNTVTYTGNGNDGLAITGVGFQPDFTWIKNRSRTVTHILTDSSRGTNKQLHTNLVNGEQTFTDFIASFDTDGFTVNDSANGQGDVNYFSGDSYVGWNWLANGGTTSSNTDGSITSTVQANTTAGFSIVTYTGTGSNATVGHGLGKALKFLIIKDRDESEGWIINSQILTGNTNGTLHFNTDAEYTGASTQFQGTNPTSSVFSIGTAGNANTSGDNHIAYCFAEIEGYSKFGSYTGNGNADGTFVYTGFKPAWLMIKRTDSTNHWTLQDNARESSNVVQKFLLANQSDAEDTSAGQDLDFLSNGFKIKNNNTRQNASGGSYIYMAFAENPFVDSNGVPVTAR